MSTIAPHLTLLWRNWSILPGMKSGHARYWKNMGRWWLGTGRQSKYLSKRRGSEKWLGKTAKWRGIMICTPYKVIQLVRMKWAGVWHALARGKCVQCFVGEPEGNGQLWRPRRRLGNSIKTGVKEIVCGGVKCIYVAKERDWRYSVVNTIMKLFLVKAVNFLNSWTTISCCVEFGVCVFVCMCLLHSRIEQL
jgi:hypothetical protein